MAMRLIDSHCHLQADRFADDVDDVIEAALAAGLERILVPGWNAWSSAAALDLVARHDWLDAAVGVHPHDAAKVDDGEWGTIAASAVDDRVVAIGETGLDFDRVFSPIDDQLANLRRNLDLSRETGKPAILHVRSAPGRADAQEALIDELRLAGFGGSSIAAAFGTRPPAVIHSFSGSTEFARAALDLGLAISISGLAFRAGEEPTAAVAAFVDPDRLLVETDSPFLTPPGGPRGRNVPAAVAITAAWVAGHRGLDASADGAGGVRRGARRGLRRDVSTLPGQGWRNGRRASTIGGGVATRRRHASIAGPGSSGRQEASIMTAISIRGFAGSRLAVAAILAVVVAGCSSNPSPSTPTGAPTPTLITSGTPLATGADTGCVVVPQTGVLRSNTLIDLTVDSDGVSDRLTFTFGPVAAGPTGGMGRLSGAVPPFTAAGSGLPVDVLGTHFVELHLDGMLIFDEAGDPFFKGATSLKPDMLALKDIEETDGFEGVYNFVIGYDGNGCVGLTGNTAAGSLTITIGH